MREPIPQCFLFSEAKVWNCQKVLHGHQNYRCFFDESMNFSTCWRVALSASQIIMYRNKYIFTTGIIYCIVNFKKKKRWHRAESLSWIGCSSHQDTLSCSPLFDCLHACSRICYFKTNIAKYLIQSAWRRKTSSILTKKMGNDKNKPEREINLQFPLQDEIGFWQK